MKRQSLKKQTILTSATSAAVRAIGFFMRLWVSRLLGAEALGVMELASGAHMLALTPAASGLPGAVSRLTAKAAKDQERRELLAAARELALHMGLILTPIFFFSAPVLARLLGDERTLPSLWFFSPCILLVGVSSVYDGHCYGLGNVWPPSLSELTEQMTRLLVTLSLLSLLPRVTVAYRAALPAFATTLGEAVGLITVIILSKAGKIREKPSNWKEIKRNLLRLSLPLMGTRVVHTGLRSLCGVMIPLRLMASGMEQREAMSRLGMLNGMVMPLLFLPGMLAGSLAVVGGPAVARCQGKAGENRMILRMLLPAALSGAACAGVVWAAAPLLSSRLYRLPELTGLMRAMCPLAVILPLQQVMGGLMTGLGLQRRSLRASLAGAAVTLLCTWRWAARSPYGIYGAGYASMAGHAVTLLLCFLHLARRRRAGD